MTRVSSYGQQQVMLNNLLRNQSNLFENQKQVASGKVHDTYKDFAGEVGTLLGSKSILTRTQTFIGSTTHVQRNLDVNNLQLENIKAKASDIRQTILETIAQDKTFVFMDVVSEAFSSIVASLNTDIGGIHIFSGGRSDIEPVTSSKLSDLVAAATPADLFQNDQRKAIAKISTNTNMEYGLLADNVGSGIFAAIKNIADFDNVTPISGDLSVAQRAFLESQLAVFDSAIDDLQIIISNNGTRYSRVTDLLQEHNEQETFMRIFVSDIEDVNMAEAITRVNNDQIALDVSYKLTSELARTSLLNFI
jgi:flagellar hook-associated protein 3 FlgL